MLTPSQTLTIGLIVAPILFLMSAYFTRATWRRILSALSGAVAYVGLNYLWDRVAAAMGWWSYPAYSATGQFPPALYALAGLVGGGAMGLVGWRIVRRWGWRGLVGDLLFWAAYALVHDYAGSKAFASSQPMVFGPGLMPILAIMLWYVTGSAAALLAIRLVGGPVNADPLARTKSAIPA